MPSSSLDHRSPRALTRLSYLIPGPESFVPDGSQGSGLRVRAWEQLVTCAMASVLLTVSSWELNPSLVAPGVFTGKDIFVEEGGGCYRVAVSSAVARFHYWYIFRCFVYPDVYGMELSRRVGYL